MSRSRLRRTLGTVTDTLADPPAPPAGDPAGDGSGHDDGSDEPDLSAYLPYLWTTSPSELAHPDAVRQHEDLARRLDGRGAVRVQLPAGCVWAGLEPQAGGAPVDLPTAGEVEVPAGHLLHLGLDGADEHADAIGRLDQVPPDVLGWVSVRGVGERTLERLAALDWPRLVGRVDPVSGWVGRGLQVQVDSGDLAASTWRWPAAVSLEAGADGRLRGLDTLDLAGVTTLALGGTAGVGGLLARLSSAAPGLRSLGLVVGALHLTDWSGLDALASVRSLSVMLHHSVAPGDGSDLTRMLAHAGAMPGLRELVVMAREQVGRCDLGGGGAPLEVVQLDVAEMDDATAVSLLGAPDLRIVTIFGVGDGPRTELLSALAAASDAVPGLSVLNLYGADVDAEETDEVADAETALLRGRPHLVLNGVELIAPAARG